MDLLYAAFMIDKLYFHRYAFLLSLIGLTASAIPADAASSKWEDLGGGKARLVATLNPNTNKVSGVVEVKLDPGWSTYWRYPGSSGIPPHFNFSDSKSFSIGDVKFPVPQLLETYDIRYAGYKKKVSFPFEGELLATNQGKIDLNLIIGVCSEICIPARAEFKIPVRELLRSDPRAFQAITLANLSLPRQAATDKIISVENGDNNDLIVTVEHSKDFGTPNLFVEGPADWYLKPAKLLHQDEDKAIFSLDLSLAPKDINPLDSKLRYTLVTGSTGVEIEH